MKNHVKSFGVYLNEQEGFYNDTFMQDRARAHKRMAVQSSSDSETELVLTLGTNFEEYAVQFSRYAEICPDCRIMDVATGEHNMEFIIAGPEDQIAALQQEQREKMGIHRFRKP